MTIGANQREMTLEEWADLDEDVEGELVDGILVEEEMPSFEHDVVVSWFIMNVGSWIDQRGGLCAASDVKFGVRPRRGRKPDATIYFPKRKPARHGLVRLPPDIALEVILPVARDRRRDRLEKTAEYAAFGIRYYWLIDPEARTLEILHLRDGQYSLALGASEGRIENVPGCEGLVLDLDRLWSKVDQALAMDSEDPEER